MGIGADRFAGKCCAVRVRGIILAEVSGMRRAKDGGVTFLRRDLRARVARRGFTLVELLITVAMIGVLAAIGLVGYRRYVHSAQGSEAKAMIQAIRGGEEAYKAEFLQYLGPSGSKSSDLKTYYPNTTPNDTRMNWAQPSLMAYTDATKGWALLNVATDAPVRFGYSCIADIGGTLQSPPDLTSFTGTMPTLPAGVPWYVVQAVNKHNPASKTMAVFASASTSGEILSQNEQD